MHVHSDFIVYLGGKAYDFTDDKYQTKTDHALHDHIHLHDNDDDVIHRHDHGITLVEFMDSLGFLMTNDCITTDENIEFCSDEASKLQLFVNGSKVDDVVNYINQEEDRLLLFYGDPEDEIISFLLDEVTDKACIYSGTCPERGIAPPESCGLTCEL